MHVDKISIMVQQEPFLHVDIECVAYYNTSTIARILFNKLLGKSAAAIWWL